MIEKEKPGRPTSYQIQVKGQIDASWSDWFYGMKVVYEQGLSTLTGPVADQAALRGILFKIWDLNLDLISVNHVDTRIGAEEQERAG